MEAKKYQFENNQLNLEGSVLDLINSARQLATPDKNFSDLIGLDMDGEAHLIIQFLETDKPEHIFRSISRKFGLEPQMTTKIEIFYSPIILDDGEKVAAILEFVQEKWKKRESLKFVGGSTHSSEILANPPRRPSQVGVYPVRGRDTIDWANIPTGTPINEGVAIKIIGKIQEMVSSLSH